MYEYTRGGKDVYVGCSSIVIYAVFGRVRGNDMFCAEGVCRVSVFFRLVWSYVCNLFV